jgi:radical SAM protein with 4Fe4S-binding SPASM domain
VGIGDFALREGSVKLSDSIRIRDEDFGALVFNTATGDTLEVDNAARAFLLRLRNAGAVDTSVFSSRKSERIIISELLSLGIAEFSTDLAPRSISFDGPQEPIPVKSAIRVLSAPETVHLAVTCKCEEDCPDCYMKRHRRYIGEELGTSSMLRVIDAIADSGAFQLAIGGGEPFLRPDLDLIASHASARNLAVHVTTGQLEINSKSKNALRCAKSLHIGLRSEELVANPKKSAEKLASLIERAGVMNIGANLIMTRLTLKNSDRILELLLGCGLKRIIFLRYKPMGNKARFESENPSPPELREFSSWLLNAKRQNPEVMSRVDCAAVFTMRDLDPLRAARSGIRGCVAGDRIMFAAPDGSVYPCSQLAMPEFRAGNLLSDSFSDIWHSAPIARTRRFKESEAYMKSVCGSCPAGPFCGGCRVFGEGGFGAEPVCPL